jgi:L-threonylcarbamoyladenylate synthase
MPPTVVDAARALASGRLVVYPTDTLLGLGARATDRAAVRRLLAAKGRPVGRPVSVTVSSTGEVERLAELSPAARRFLRTHLPGPYTVLVRPSKVARRTLAPSLFGGGRTLGVRLPDHPTARELARRAGPLTATSANRHGEPPCRTPAEVRRTFGSQVAVVLPARPPASGVPSTLIDLTGPFPHEVTRRGR